MTLPDHLSTIIALLAPAAWRALPPDQRAALLVQHGTLDAARQAAWGALPEPLRVALIKGYGTAPEACGPELTAAPARGALFTFDQMQVYPDGDSETRIAHGGFQGRKTARRVDAFDRMRVQAERTRGAGGFALSPSQIGMGRLYGGLVQDREAGGVRCIDLSAEVRGGSPEGFTDARLDLARRIERLRGLVGPGVALSVRRLRPSRRGAPGRCNIADLSLVDAVCVQDLTLSDVLARHGWSIKGDTVAALGAALAGALDRMIGPVRAGRIVVWRGAAE